MASLDPLGHGTSITPDSQGSPEWTVDATGGVTHQVWSGGLLRSETDASGTRTEYDYIIRAPGYLREDPSGNPWAMRRFDAEDWPLSITTARFDRRWTATPVVDALHGPRKGAARRVEALDMDPAADLTIPRPLNAFTEVSWRALINAVRAQFVCFASRAWPARGTSSRGGFRVLSCDA